MENKGSLEFFFSHNFLKNHLDIIYELIVLFYCVFSVGWKPL